MSHLIAAGALSLGLTFLTGGLDAQPLASTATWHPVAASADNCATANATCLTLPDGKILIAGGTHEGRPLASVEIYNSAASSWESAASMQEPRAGHSATLLQDRRVLIAGGGTRSLEIFDPATKTFTAVAGQLSVARSRHAAALLSNGAVLITGGWDGVVALDSADIYDPVTGNVAPAGFLTTARYNHTATTLLDGKVLLSGGEGLASAEIYDPELQSFSPGNGMTTARAGHAAILLAGNNQVLLAGGRAADGAALASAEIYTPWTGEFASTAPMSTARANPLGRIAPGGGVAIVAGEHDRTADGLRFPTLQSRSSAAGTLVIEGKNWQAGKTVRLSGNSPDKDWTAAPDIAGSFRLEFPNATSAFTLTARSGSWRAQITSGASTTTMIVSYPQNPVYGDADAFTITVAGGIFIPTGTVTLLDSATTIGSGSISPISGQAMISAVLAAGTHSITASYGGNAFDASSVSSPVTVTVSQDVPAVLLSSSLNPLVFGAPVTFSEAVMWTGSGSLAGAAPTGNVTFSASSVTLGAAPLVSGTATLPAITLLTFPVGHYSFSTSYGGDTNYSAVTAQFPQTVAPAKTAVTVTNLGSAVSGQPITISYTVSAQSPSVVTPQGNVTISVDDTTSGTSTLDSNGAGSTVLPFPSGMHDIHVTYPAIGNFAGSVGFSQIMVFQNTPTVRLVSSANPSVTGQSVTFTASVIPMNNGAFPATGAMNFFDGSAPLGAVSLNTSGVATFSTSALSAAAHSITATYGGDTNFSGAANILTQTVNAGPVLAISKSHSAAFNQGQQGLTYSIKVSNTGTVVNTGLVTVTEQVPTGLTLASMSGSGWNCAILPVCTRSDMLAAHSSYPNLTATVNVASDAPSMVTNQVTVTGGTIASDPAAVAVFSCDLNGDGPVNVADVQTEINVALGVISPVAVDDLNHDGVVNVADVQKDINAALSLGCVY